MSDPAQARPAEERATGTVLHAVWRFGGRSQTFVPQLIGDLDSLGWAAWVASESAPSNRDEFPFPEDERMLQPAPLGRVARVAARRLAGRRRRLAAAPWRPLVARARPSLIHSHFAWPAARAALESLGPPLVVSFHASDVLVWPHESPAKRRYFCDLARRLRWAIASSEFIAEHVRRLGYAGELEIIPPGVPLDRFAFRDPRLQPEDPHLLYVGRQVPRKGLDVLLRALPEVLAPFPRARLTVIGDGADAARNQALAQTLNLHDSVRFLGEASHERVANALRSADVLVVPSRTMPSGEAEGHPVAPKEAYASGVLVVATDCGGTREVVPPAQRGDLVPEDDAEALAAALTQLLAAPGAWFARAQEGRRWVEEQFDTRKLATRVAALYARMVAEKHGP